MKQRDYNKLRKERLARIVRIKRIERGDKTALDNPISAARDRIAAYDAAHADETTLAAKCRGHNGLID